ncbi:Protein canopy 4 [Armadillidium nasatum]|uniref:Protein canopy 4 n=1 Tax=Armadillidium nasatum TaxID=96803 RepID=A0A5N5TMX3_9CRUS|nr:Protein canopy 4 [Armadillidium nasatum]
MFSRRISIPQIWGILSRTRPMAPSPQKPPAIRSQKKLCRIFNTNFWYFVYQGLGVTAPFGLCYVVGIVVEETKGDGVPTAVLVAMVTSLLTGLCFSELISSNRHCSGNAGTAIYQLVGEFPAFMISVLSVFVSCSCFAAMSKALSSTMEELSHERLTLFLANNIGTLPLSNLPPDILAFGAALVTSVLLACGLKQAGVLRTAMNIFCFAGVLFFLTVGGSHTRSADSSVEKQKSGSQEIYYIYLYYISFMYQFLELGRRSKDQSQTDRTLPFAVTFTTAGVMVTSLAIGIVLSLMIDNRPPVSGAPLLHAFQLRDVGWARLLMGSLQVIVLGLGMSESGEFVCRTLVTMSSEGFIPSFLSLECPFAFSYSRAHLVGGISASVIALFFTHVYLLQVMAANILLTNIIITTITLYRPYRCSYDSLCTVAVTPSSRPCRRLSPSSYLKGKTSKNNMNSERTLHFLKTGIGVLAFKRNEKRDGDDELSIPLLTSLHSANAVENESLDEFTGK